MNARKKPSKRSLIYQFRITLEFTDPAVWRIIQVPGDYSFWDLHVAITDAMGWLDYHLHAFLVPSDSRHDLKMIGIPDDEGWGYGPETLPGWAIPVFEHFILPGDIMQYDYDFGDGWKHTVLLESITLVKSTRYYPKCIDGARACPPEDCGGPGGYNELLDILQDPESEDYLDTKNWLKGHAKKYWPYDPNRFNPKKVRFDDPNERWEIAFGDDDDL